MQVYFAWSQRELVNLATQANDSSIAGEKVRISDYKLGWLPKGINQFLGLAADFYPDFHKSPQQSD